jgi:hypothetical protein
VARLPGWRILTEGVYECGRGSDAIRVLVLRQLPQMDHNAALHLLSATPELVGYGASHYQKRSVDTSTLIYQLFESFEREEIAVSYTMEDFRRDFVKEHFKDLTPEERLESIMMLPPEEQLELFKKPAPKQRRKPPKKLTPELRLHLLEDLTPEELDEIEKYVQRRKREATSGKKKKKNGPASHPRRSGGTSAP